MQRRDLLKLGVWLPTALSGGALAGCAGAGRPRVFASRVRAGDPDWPAPERWEELGRSVGGRLLRPASPFDHCAPGANAACDDALRLAKNPFWVGDQPALTQSSGWYDAWISQPSAYAVAAETTADVVAAVNFAREHRLRLVVKGGGHSYQGNCSAPDSLLVWTRRMHAVTVHDAFVADGCAALQAPQPAVSLGAGAMWVDAYDAVTTRAGRYVQGGGCTTVGVAGLIQSGGFGSFSKNFGTAASALLEAEVVTADGVVRIANAATHPDLFWALKGGGGGSFGVVTRVTLRTRELPATVGAVGVAIKAANAAAYRALIAQAVAFYAQHLCNPHWGEQMTFRSDDTLRVSMLFQGFDQAQARAIWGPFVDWVRARGEYTFAREFACDDLPARKLWDAAHFKANEPGAIVVDDRPGAAAHHYVWRGDQKQVGQFVHAYKSAWLPASLLRAERRAQLADALFEATRHWELSLHFNKGLAGAPPAEIDAARDTATNPAVLDAFALAICGAEGPPAYPGMPDAKPDAAEAQRAARGTAAAMQALLQVAPGAGSYVSESDYFQADWQRAFWGANYARLRDVKRRYDPDGLFFVHHGVGSEDFSPDGQTRIRQR